MVRQQAGQAVDFQFPRVWKKQHNIYSTPLVWFLSRLAKEINLNMMIEILIFSSCSLLLEIQNYLEELKCVSKPKNTK